MRTSLGCHGDSLVISPHIDRLAQQSRLFTRAYCNQAVCGPSRTAVLTGRLPDNTRVWHNWNRFRDTHPNLVTLPQPVTVRDCCQGREPPATRNGH